MYGMLGSMDPHRFIYIRQLPGVSVLRPHGVYAWFICPLAVLNLQLNTCVPCAAPFGNDYFNKGGALQVYGTL